MGARLLDELDGLVHRSVLGGAAEVQELEQPEAECRQYGRVDPIQRAAGEVRDHVVERRPPLDGAVRERHRQRAVARLELGRLGCERAIGEAPCSNTRRITRSAQARAGETRLGPAWPPKPLPGALADSPRRSSGGAPEAAP